MSDLFGYSVALGDDALILSHRLCEWATHAPAIEEDVALMNIALDLLGQSRMFYGYACTIEGASSREGAESVEGAIRTEDDLAYLREERAFTNLQITELDNGDFGVSMARQLLFSAYQCELYDALAASCDEQLAAIAAKARKETDYHRDHATNWVLRLGDGTDESHTRMQAGLDTVWPFAAEMFMPVPGWGDLVAAGVAVDPVTLEAPWSAYLCSVVSEATLELPSPTWAPGGGRSGLHTETFGYLLAEMQHLHRAFPGASW